MGEIIIGNELRCAKRQALEDIVPLPTPFLLFLEPTNLCNFRCRFCPTGNPDLLQRAGRKAGLMSMELFKKVVSDLQEFPDPIKSLNFYKDGEPLVHPDFPEMYHYLKESGVAGQIRVKSNGSLLNPRLNRRLIDAGLEWIGISVEAVSAGKYWDMCAYRLDYEKFLDNLRDLYERRGACHIHIKIINAGLSEAEKDQFFRDFSPLSDTCAIENLHGWNNAEMRDFSLGIEQMSMDGVELVDKMVCPLPLFALAINCDGTVSICCVDWSHSTVVGNVETNSLSEIWHGERLRDFRMMHLERRRSENLACRDCTFIRTLPDNIDGRERKIIEKLRGGIG
jgi:radical SAM protein with 4Fe4S-binding SPASM domain